MKQYENMNSSNGLYMHIGLTIHCSMSLFEGKFTVYTPK